MVGQGLIIFFSVILNRSMTRDEVLSVLLKLTPGVPVQATRLADLVGLDREVLVDLLEEMQGSNSLPGVYLSLEQVFIRWDLPYQRCSSCGFFTFGYSCRNCTEEVSCGICKGSIREGDAVEFCPHCGFVGHRDHLREWVRLKGICPWCKAELGGILEGESDGDTDLEVDLVESDAKILRELEVQVGRIPLLDEIDWNAFGFAVEDGRVVGLSLPRQGLIFLPDNIGDLTMLSELNVWGNHLSLLPESIGELVNLKELRLWGNQLSSLPESIGNLRNLEYLDVSRNRLSSLPEGLFSLGNLRKLFVHENELRVLSGSIGNLSNLQKLWMHDNQLTTLPESIGDLSDLRELYIYNNPLDSLSEGAQRALQALEERRCMVYQ